MSLTRFIDDLEEAVDNISVEQRYVLASLLRRAAFLFRSSDMAMIEPEMEQTLSDVAAKLGKPKADLIHRILQEWLERNFVDETT
jgi:hypothetical protein